MKIHPTLLKFVSCHIAPQDTWTKQIRKNTFFVLCRATRYVTRQSTKYKVNKTSNFVLSTLFAHKECPQLPAAKVIIITWSTTCDIQKSIIRLLKIVVGEKLKRCYGPRSSKNLPLRGHFILRSY